jgi:hypothetical protein
VTRYLPLLAVLAVGCADARVLHRSPPPAGERDGQDVAAADPVGGLPEGEVGRRRRPVEDPGVGAADRQDRQQREIAGSPASNPLP